MTGPDPRLEQALDAFRRLYLQAGVPPTIGEVARLMGVPHVTSAKRWLDRLVRAGRLARGPTASRNYRLPTDEAFAARRPDGRVVLHATGDVTFTPAEWRAWLLDRLRELDGAA